VGIFRGQTPLDQLIKSELRDHTFFRTVPQMGFSRSFSGHV
jgi:hypothetical protein